MRYKSSSTQLSAVTALRTKKHSYELVVVYKPTVEDQAAEEIFQFVHDFQSASSTLWSIPTTSQMQNVHTGICIIQRPRHFLVQLILICGIVGKPKLRHCRQFQNF